MAYVKSVDKLHKAIEKDLRLQAKREFDAIHKIIMNSINKKPTKFEGIFSKLKNYGIRKKRR